MAVTNSARTNWKGDLQSGQGRTELVTSGAAQFDVHWKARSEGSDSVTTPEELIAAAHASCFSMAFSKALADNGTTADEIDVQATVTFVPGTGITGSSLIVEADVPGIEDEDFQRLAEEAKAGCPVSQALGGISITLASATLR